ncbi:MAG: hypothetical protein AAF557_12760 [Pseudomonadota bacterium]
MFRALIFALVTAMALPASAEEQSAMIRAGDTAQMNVGESQAIAFYTTDRKGMRVTMVFTDSEGETMRTRILLDDGQTHAIVFDASEDFEDGYRFSFRRNGDTVEMTGEDRSGPTEVAARY